MRQTREDTGTGNSTGKFPASLLSTTIITMKAHARLAQLLFSNEAPNVREVEDVKTEMTVLSDKISHLRSQLEELEGNFNRYKAILSPIRKIPLELLGEIFEMALPDHMNIHYESRLLKLCLVCKNWRDAAHLTRPLWSGLSLRDDQIHYRKIVNWFTRAGNVPKTLQIGAKCSYTDHLSKPEPCNLSSHDVSRLLASGPSFHHLSLTCTSLRCFLKMADALKTFAPASYAESRPFDAIRSLTLNLTGSWQELANPSDSAFHRIPSSVTSFQLFLPAHHDAFGHLDAERPLHLTPQFLGNLTSFSICCDWEGGVQLITALHHCVNMETLTIDFNDSLSWWYDSDEPFIEQFQTDGLLLPKVRTLSLERASPHSISILELLKTPALETLSIGFSIYCHDMEDYDFALEVHDFINNRSQCEATFRSLRLERLVGMRGEELQSLLHGLPTITHLVLDHIKPIPSYRSVLAQLAVRLDPTFLPNLESLKIYGLPPESVERDASLFRFLNARRRHDAMDFREDGVIFQDPPDGLKELILSFRRTLRLKDHGLDHNNSVSLFKRHCGVLFNIGPLLYYDDPNA
jgi:hypothetical protein